MGTAPEHRAPFPLGSLTVLKSWTWGISSGFNGRFSFSLAVRTQVCGLSTALDTSSVVSKQPGFVFEDKHLVGTEGAEGLSGWGTLLCLTDHGTGSLQTLGAQFVGQ